MKTSAFRHSPERWWRAWAALLSLAALAGCNAGQVFIASPGDYADYRRVRIADSYDGRMAAAWHYLQERPDGRYAERLRAYFARAEPVFYRVRSKSIPGIQAYLSALPDGPHSKDALVLLGELKRDRRREELDMRAARQTTARLDAEKQNLALAAGMTLFWTRSLLEPSLWKAPFDEASPELLSRFRLALPEPICHADDPAPGQQRCGKTVTTPYTLRVGRKRLERSISLDVELVLGEGYKLDRAILSGRGLLLRGEEARVGKPLDDGSADEHRRASERFLAELTMRLFADQLLCNGGTDDGGTTLLVCEDLRVTVEPGGTKGDDLFIIEPVAAAEPASAPDADSGAGGAAPSDAPVPGPEPVPAPTEP